MSFLERISSSEERVSEFPFSDGSIQCISWGEDNQGLAGDQAQFEPSFKSSGSSVWQSSELVWTSFCPYARSICSSEMKSGMDLTRFGQLFAQPPGRRSSP